MGDTELSLIYKRWPSLICKAPHIQSVPSRAVKSGGLPAELQGPLSRMVALAWSRWGGARRLKQSLLAWTDLHPHWSLDG